MRGILNHHWGNSPSSNIWGLVNGYSPHVRAKKPLAFFEAYFDDSRSNIGEERLFIAGYLNSAEKWALFVDAWQECLDEKPAIAYLKMLQAQALQGEFRGWHPDARDAKLSRLAFIVRHFDPLSFEFSVSCRTYRDTLAHFAPRGLNPHFYCVHGILATVTRFLESRGAVHPVKFFFDEQNGVDTDIALFFDYIRSQLSGGAKDLISGLPTFESDQNLLPLQAADFLAWHVRREDEGSLSDQALINLLRTEHVRAHLDDTHLEAWRAEFEQLPGLDRMQSKGEWHKVRAALVAGKAAGFLPPYGTKWLNFRGGIRDWIKDRKRSIARLLR